MDDFWINLSEKLSSRNLESDEDDHDALCEEVLDNTSAAQLFKKIPTVILKRSVVESCVYKARSNPPKRNVGEYAWKPLDGRREVLRACLECAKSPDTGRLLAAFLEHRICNNA